MSHNNFEKRITDIFHILTSLLFCTISYFYLFTFNLYTSMSFVSKKGFVKI